MIEDLKISILIPTYNRSMYLKKCIESIISQNHDDIEIIISDNNSPDNTEEIVNLFIDKRIKYYKNSENIGSNANFYKLIELANGEFVFFLTDDDYLLPGAIAEIKNFIKINKHIDAFKCDLIVYNERSKTAFNYKYFDHSIIDKNIDIETKSKIWQSSHIFTGCCFRRLLIPNGIQNDFFTWYPSMLVFGLFDVNQGYLSAPVAVHVWENELFWNIDNKEKELILLKSKISILPYLLNKGKNIEYVNALAHKIFEDAAEGLNYELDNFPPELCSYLSSTQIKIIRKAKAKIIFKNVLKRLLIKSINFLKKVL